MGKLSISYAGHLSDRVRDLYTGTVTPEGIDLHFIPLSPVQAFNRMLNGEFDCGEMSFSTYVIMAAKKSRSSRREPSAMPRSTSIDLQAFRHRGILLASGSAFPNIR